MPHVTVLIDGKQFRLACEDGQEAHLSALANGLDERIKTLRVSFGEIGDLRLAIMAGLMLSDEVSEEKRKSADVVESVRLEREALQKASSSTSDRDTEIAAVIDQLSARLERITRALTGQDREGF